MANEECIIQGFRRQFRFKRIKSIVIALIFISIVMCQLFHMEISSNVQSDYTRSPCSIPIEYYRVRPSNWQQQTANLPDLVQMNWPPTPIASVPAGGINAEGRVNPLPGPFRPVMSQMQRRGSYRLLRTFTEYMFKNSLGDRFILLAGSLIGSYRHHDFIPWDEDIDVLVDLSVQQRVRDLLQTLKPNYLFHETVERDKLYLPLVEESELKLDVERSRPIKKWAWPFLDIGYFDRNATHIWDIAEEVRETHAWPISVVFPVYFRPFGRQWYPTPRDTATFLRTTFGSMKLCQTTSWSHVREQSFPPFKSSCETLTGMYAFIRRGNCCTATSVSGVRYWGETLIREQQENSSKEVYHTLCIPEFVSEKGEA